MSEFGGYRKHEKTHPALVGLLGSAALAAAVALPKAARNSPQGINKVFKKHFCQPISNTVKTNKQTKQTHCAPVFYAKQAACALYYIRWHCGCDPLNSRRCFQIAGIQVPVRSVCTSSACLPSTQASLTGHSLILSNKKNKKSASSIADKE